MKNTRRITRLFSLLSTSASSLITLGMLSTMARAQVTLSPQTVQVPASMASAPFNTPRTLNIPQNFNIAVYARVGGARFLTFTPDGNLLVSQPGSGKISLVRANANGNPTVSDFATGMNKPHDMVFHTIGATTWLYVSESDQIDRFPYNNGDLTAHNEQIVISGLPDDSSGELQGRYAHALKNFAIDGNDKLYVEVASATNADPADVTANPPRATIYQYNADGTGKRLFATGLRNAEGLAIVPNTVNNLWVCVNNRDNIAYPFHNDWDGDGSDDYGKMMSSYVDNHPPEEFTHVRDGGNYGWPYANPNPDTSTGYDNMPFDLDVQNNADGSHGAASGFDRINKGIQAHSAPLGLTFLGATAFPAAYRNGVTIALHGSWNRTQKTGYKVIYFPWDTTTQTPGAQADFVSGWADASSNWGRPVDTAVDAQGNMFISDDGSGTIYKLSQNVAPPTPTPTPTPSPTPTPTTGTGLNGTYFNSENFANPVLNRTDATVNFNWGGGSPALVVQPNAFSVRWTGQIQATTTGKYVFSTVSDDGVRLWINGVRVINNWTRHGPTINNSAGINLVAGRKYAIKMEYFDHAGGAIAKLLWKTPGASSQTVPQSQMFPN